MEERGYLIWERAWGSDGCERYGPVSRTMGDGCAGRAPAMILAPVPRERERWYALWLLTQGWTAQATAEALERDPHTIGTVVGRLRRGWAHSLDIRAVRWCPPALGSGAAGGAAGGAERGGAGVARQLRHGTGQLELESGLPVRLRALRYQPEPQHLPQLSAPAGILLQTPQETAAQG